MVQTLHREFLIKIYIMKSGIKLSLNVKVSWNNMFLHHGHVFVCDILCPFPCLSLDFMHWSD